MSSVYDDLLELERYIHDQIYIETVRPTYNGTQRAIAYHRVLNRLRAAIEKASRLREEFNLTE